MTGDSLLRLYRAANLAALRASVSRGLIHDIRNPLQALSLTAQTMGARPSDQDAEFLLSTVRRAAEQLERTVGHMELLFSDGSAQEAAPLLLPGVFAALADVHGFQRGLPPAVLEVVPPGPLAPVAATEGDLLHALLALITNSKEAAPRGSEPHIRLAAKRMAAQVLITLEDDGPGIPEDLRERIFVPGFTSRPDEALGLGLTVARAIAEGHGGFLRAEAPAGGEGAGARLVLGLKVWGR